MHLYTINFNVSTLLSYVKYLIVVDITTFASFFFGLLCCQISRICEKRKIEKLTKSTNLKQIFTKFFYRIDNITS